MLFLSTKTIEQFPILSMLNISKAVPKQKIKFIPFSTIVSLSMAKRIHGCLPYQHFPRNLLFDNIKKIRFSLRDWASLIPLMYSRAMTSEYTLILRIRHLAWKNISHPLLFHEWYEHTKEKFILKIRDGTYKFAQNGTKIPHIGRYGGLMWQNWFKGFWMHKQ